MKAIETEERTNKNKAGNSKKIKTKTLIEPKNKVMEKTLAKQTNQADLLKHYNTV